MYLFDFSRTNWTYTNTMRSICRLFSVIIILQVVKGQDSLLSSRIEAGRGTSGLCNRGLRYQTGRGCVDINECLEQAPCLTHQTCRNLWGSYFCVCPTGFQLNSRTGECEDKDECAIGYCGNGQRCINTIGSFTCECAAGMTKVGRFCRDINECQRNPCDSNQHCINTRGSYMCRCRRGFQQVGNGRCMDTDECRQGVCRGLGEECRNTVGSYECVCTNGFYKDERTHGRYCLDVNECDLNQCPSYSECINTQGSFHCRCHRGFTNVNGICVDNQECSLGEGSKCQWRCQNVPGSFLCECPSGYKRNEFACNDINECDTNGKEICPGHGTCVNTHGGYKCVDAERCPNARFYRKLMKTDEFGYRQVTTNTCRRRSCRRVTQNNAEYVQCKQQPLSVSYHYVDITSELKVPSDLLRVNFPARRRRQRYHFRIAHGNRQLFALRQPSMYRPMAYLVLNRAVRGPAEFTVQVDMRTYNRRNEMRDNRMMNVQVIVSRYQF